MKILLQDGKTAIENVARVDERKPIDGQQSTLAIIIPAENITADEIAKLATDVGFDELTIMSDDGETSGKYSGVKVKNITTSHMDSGKNIRITLKLKG